MLALVAILILGVPTSRADTAAPTFPALAPSAPLSAPSAADRAQAEQLIKTLEDPDARAKLVGQLRLLTQVEKPPAPTGAKNGPLDQLAQTLEDAGDSILTATAEIADFGNMVDWLDTQANDPHAQQLVTRVLIRLAAVFVGGLIVEWLLGRLLTRPKRFIETRTVSNRWLRIPLAAAHWIGELVPVAGFAASAYAMLALPYYRPGGHSERVSVAAITAYALAATASTLVNAIFAPGRPSLRAIAVGDQIARRLAVRSRRILRIAIWGYYLDDALRILGMPQSAFDSVLKLLGLALSIMLVALVFEYRRPVSRWIKGAPAIAPDAPPGRAEFERRLAGARGTLAEVWHVLAALYVLAAFVIWALRVEGGFEFLLRATLLTAAILAIARLIVGTLGRQIDRAFNSGVATDEHEARVGARRRRYRRIARLVLQLAVAIVAAMAILQAWGADTLDWLGGDTGQRVVGSAATIVAVIAVAVGVWELVGASIERYLASTDLSGRPVARSGRARTLLPLMRNAFTVLLVLVVAMVVLSEIGVNVAPLIAGAGVLGVAIGFGSQKLVQDVITGAFMLFEDTIAIGDTVAIGDHVGIVEGMTIRTMSIRAGNGDLHTVPFSSVGAVVNQSRGFAYFPFSVGVSYGEDVDKVMEVMRAVGVALRDDPAWSQEIGAPIEVFGIDRFSELAVIVSGQIRTRPGLQVTVGREYYRRLKKRFDELGIVIPHTIAVDVKSASAAVPPARSAPAGPAPEPDAREP